MNTEGDVFQKKTEYSRDKVFGSLDWNNRPPTHKYYENKLKHLLPEPEELGGVPFWDVINRRRSIRRFSNEPMDLIELSQLLWGCNGVTERRQNYSFRSAPSAGALYPIETYILINKVIGLEPGIYHYEVEKHQLAQVKTGEYSDYVTEAILGQKVVQQAAVTFIWSAVFARSKWKYKQRAYRYIYLDAGHIAQNLALSAVALDLGSCQIGAFYDEEMDRLLELDGEEESVIYLSAVGKTL